MPFPFVSRERLDEEKARTREQKDRAEKAEAALEEMRAKFLEYIDKHRIQPLKIDEETDLGSIQPIEGRPTIGSVISFANRGAYQAAMSGKESVALGIEKERAKMMNIKRAANGG